MRGRKRLRRRPRHVGREPSREDKHHGGLHALGPCSAGCGVGYHQKMRLHERRRVWFRWVGKPGGHWASCRKDDPGAVAPLRKL